MESRCRVKASLFLQNVPMYETYCPKNRRCAPRESFQYYFHLCFRLYYFRFLFRVLFYVNDLHHITSVSSQELWFFIATEHYNFSFCVVRDGSTNTKEYFLLQRNWLYSILVCEDWIAGFNKKIRPANKRKISNAFLA